MPNRAGGSSAEGGGVVLRHEFVGFAMDYERGFALPFFGGFDWVHTGGIDATHAGRHPFDGSEEGVATGEDEVEPAIDGGVEAGEGTFGDDGGDLGLFFGGEPAGGAAHGDADEDDLGLGVLFSNVLDNIYHGGGFFSAEAGGGIGAGVVAGHGGGEGFVALLGEAGHNLGPLASASAVAVGEDEDGLLVGLFGHSMPGGDGSDLDVLDSGWSVNQNSCGA